MDTWFSQIFPAMAESLLILMYRTNFNTTDFVYYGPLGPNSTDNVRHGACDPGCRGHVITAIVLIRRLSTGLTHAGIVYEIVSGHGDHVTCY